MYVSYEFYKDVYFGESIPANKFDVAEIRAESLIRYLTFHNGDIFAEENDSVKFAVCAAADVVYNLTTQKNSTGTEAGSIKSVNNDGYAVAFAVEKTDGQTAEMFLRRKVYDAITVYLAPTGWLSRWVRR